MKNIFRKCLCAVAVGVSCVLAANAEIYKARIDPLLPLDRKQWNSVAVGQRLAVENGFLLYIVKVTHDAMGQILQIWVAYDDQTKNCPGYLKGAHVGAWVDVSISMGRDTMVPARWCEMPCSRFGDPEVMLFANLFNNPPAMLSTMPMVKFKLFFDSTLSERMPYLSDQLKSILGWPR